MRDRIHNKVQNRETQDFDSYLNAQGATFFEPSEGTNDIDILPYLVSVKGHYMKVPVGDLWCERVIWVHYNVGPDDKAVICPKTIKKPCPICRALKQAQRQGGIDEEELKGQRAKKRVLYNVMVDGDIFLWEISYHNFGKQLEKELDDQDGTYDGYAEMEDGFTINVRMAEAKIGKTSFLQADRIDFSNRDDLDDDLLEDVQDLDTILVVQSADELEAIFLGEDTPEPTTDPDDDLDYGDEEPQDDPDPEEEPEPEDDDNLCVACEGSGENTKGRKCRICGGSGEKPEPEDDEPEEKPARKPKKKKAKKQAKQECPHELNWGADCDEYDVCEKCDLWDPCLEAKTKM